MRTRLVLLPLIVALAVTFAACGGDDDTSSDSDASGDMSGADSTVDVLAEDISFPQDVYETDAGTVGFVYENVGNIRHTLVIEDVDGFELDVNVKGDVDEGTVDLAPGEYTLFCDIPGHRPAGMVAELIVG